jgi:hypothetical protein
MNKYVNTCRTLWELGLFAHTFKTAKIRLLDSIWLLYQRSGNLLSLALTKRIHLQASPVNLAQIHTKGHRYATDSGVEFGAASTRNAQWIKLTTKCSVPQSRKSYSSQCTTSKRHSNDAWALQSSKALVLAGSADTQKSWRRACLVLKCQIQHGIVPQAPYEKPESLRRPKLQIAALFVWLLLAK